jgi:hypothetical protein
MQHELPQWVDTVEKVFSGRWTKFFSAAGASGPCQGEGPHRVARSHYRALYMSCRGLQQRKHLKTDFCEISRAAQFSTFSTASVRLRRSNMSAVEAAFVESGDRRRPPATRWKSCDRCPTTHFRDVLPVSSFVRPEPVLPSRPWTVEVHGAQRRSGPASWPPREVGLP